MYKNSVLPNDLRIVSHDIKDRDSIALGFWIGVGGRHEEARIKGAAHFLEHIVFKGTHNYRCEEIKEKIEGVGGALNAFTSEEYTCYYAKIPTKHLDKTFDVLSDMVLSPKITSKDVRKESTVIIEEIKMYYDVPQYYALELLDGIVWPEHPLGKNLAGSATTVSQMGNRDLKGFHKTYYCPQNIVVSACGNIQHSHILKLTKNKFGGMKPKELGDFVKADNSQSAPRCVFHKRDIEQMHVALGMIGCDQHHEDRYVLNLLNVILGGNMSSRLFVEVREKRGLAYSISSSMKALQDTGLFLIRAGVDNTKIVESVEVIIKELDKMKRRDVSPGEFIRARDYLLGQLQLGLEDTLDHMLWLGESMTSRNRLQTLSSLIKKFQKIKRSDVKRVAKTILHEGRINLAVVGPMKGRQEKQLKQLLGCP